MKSRISLFIAILLFAVARTALAQAPVPPPYDISKDPVLYTVGYAHLDTEWRWDYEETVNSFLKATLDDNFERFGKYGPYVFSFSGARRYRMMKEYYPGKYDTLRGFIARGRWFVAGSSVDECDVNIPSPESVIRHVLYGNGYFRSEFGKESVDFLLPDCFGFQAWLPSALAHAGVKGFSTQKLVWGSAVGIPFNIGNWNGPDGKGVVAALNATDYTGRIKPGLDTAAYWVNRVTENGKKYGVFADYRYYGVGDVGGAPREADIANAVAAVESPNPLIHVRLTSSDQLFRDLTPALASRLPVYSGDLLLTQHSAGSLTSQAYMKRWNRKNELLARAAEPLAVAADWLGGLPYPSEILHEAWWTLLGSQMHDILPGTSIPKAYEYAWNDEVLSLNRFASVAGISAGVLARALDTQVKGQAVVVWNPLSIQREDVVEAEIPYPDGAPEQVIVTDPSGIETPSQVIARSKLSLTVLFPARVPACGMAVYDISPSKEAGKARGTVTAGTNFLENEYYKVVLNKQGDIASVIDKKLLKELLSGPSRLEFLNEHPDYWPAWNMDWKDRREPPAGFVDGPARITLTENGPVRCSYRIEREARNSRFVTTVRLSTGEAGRRVEVLNKVYWQSKGVSLKAAFPLKVKNEMATYNMGLGTIERGTNSEKKYEVPSREWFDLTDRAGGYGVTIMEDSKFGSDKPNDSTLRLTLLYTPLANSFPDQATQDWGIHEFTYGIYSHKGDWRTGQWEWQAHRLNQPLLAFLSPSHPGALGKSFSFARLSTPQADIRAIKKTEAGDAILFRIQELTGRSATGVELVLPAKVLEAWETDGQERRTGDIALTNGKLVLSLEPYALRSIAVKLAAPETSMNPASSYPQALMYNWDVVSADSNRRNGSLNAEGVSIPAEQFPAELTFDGIRYTFGGSTDNQNNVVRCSGQKISLPKTGNFNKVCILAAATSDTTAVFRVAGQKRSLRIQAATGNIGQFDRREWDALGRISGIVPGFIKRDEVAWNSTHLHNDTSNLPYRFAYLYRYELAAGPGSESIQFPDNNAVMIFALTLAEDPFGQVTEASPLYDLLDRRESLDLKPDRRYVTAAMKATAEITGYRERNPENLPVKVTMKDYADIHRPNGVTVSYISSTGKPGEMVSAPYVNDGMFELLPGDSAKDTWTMDGEGRLLMDLQREIDIDSMHLFAVSEMARGPQRFSVWGKSQGNPTVTGDPAAAGWTFIAAAEPLEIWGNAKAVYRVVSLSPIRYRYLMFISEDSGYGPYYFREADVFENQH